MKELQQQLRELQQQLVAAQKASYPSDDARTTAVMGVQGQISTVSGALMTTATRPSPVAPARWSAPPPKPLTAGHCVRR